ncbi:MAG: hypothetical protein ACRD16_15555 [Thermoanaerobaculia bacterium]
MIARRFPIRFDRWYGVLSRLCLLLPSQSYVDVDPAEVAVKMGWGFRARFPRSAVSGAAPAGRRYWSRGVHGFFGTWLVNGSGDGIVSVALAPPQRARVMGFPVRLRELRVSVEDPAAFIEAVRNGG